MSKIGLNLKSNLQIKLSLILYTHGRFLRSVNRFSEPLMTLSVRTLDATTNVPIPGAYISFETMTTPEIEGEGETDQSGILHLGQFPIGQV